MGSKLLDVVDVVREDLMQEDTSHFVDVTPPQMKLLRKMSAVGLGPEDVDPYKRKEQLVGADAAPAPQNITLLAAFFAPLLWAPWGSMIYMACLPLMFAVVWLASSMPQEIARIKDRALVDEEQTILASVAASSRSRRKHVAASSTRSRGRHGGSARGTHKTEMPPADVPVSVDAPD